MKIRRQKERRKRRLTVFMCVLLALAVLGAILYKPVRTQIEQRLYPLEYSAEVQRWAGEYGVDPYLVYAIIRTESGFDAEADSSAGARGLMQMTEETFDWIKTKIAPSEPLVFADLYNPEVSIRFGTYFFSISLQRYGGDISTAAAAYHSGWGTVDGLLHEETYTENRVWLTQFPYSQMGHYVNKINQSYQKYTQLYTE